MWVANNKKQDDEEEEEFDPVKELKYEKKSFEGLLKEKNEAVKSGNYAEDDYVFLSIVQRIVLKN